MSVETSEKVIQSAEDEENLKSWSERWGQIGEHSFPGAKGGEKGIK